MFRATNETEFVATPALLQIQQLGVVNHCLEPVRGYL